VLARHSFFQLVPFNDLASLLSHTQSKQTRRLAPHDRAGERKQSQRRDKQVAARPYDEEVKQKERRAAQTTQGPTGPRKVIGTTVSEILTKI